MAAAFWTTSGMEVRLDSENIDELADKWRVWGKLSTAGVILLGPIIIETS